MDNDYVISLVRTVVPSVVGWLAVWLSDRFGVEIDSSAVSAALVSLVSAAYYALARAVERRWPWLRLLLVARQPTYTSHGGSGA